MFNRISLKTAPEVKQVVRAAFPSYAKHDAYLSEFNGGVTINSFWDGGSKDVFVIVELATLRHRALPTSTHPYFDMHGATGQNPDVTVDRGMVTLNRLPEGFALVAGGVFCGKLATAHVYLNAANMTKMLPSITD